MVSISTDYIFISVNGYGVCAGWILELDRGRGIPFEGNYSQWLEAKAKRLGAEAKKQSALQKQIEAELEWVRSQAKGQQKKGKSRMRRYDELVQQVCRMCLHLRCFRSDCQHRTHVTCLQ